MSALARRNMDRAVSERQDVIEASLPKCTTSSALEAELRGAWMAGRTADTFEFASRCVELYCKLVDRLAAIYTAEIEHRKGMQS